MYLACRRTLIVSLLFGLVDRAALAASVASSSSLMLTICVGAEHSYVTDSNEIAPEPTGHGLPLSKCEAYNRVYEQSRIELRSSHRFSAVGAGPRLRTTCSPLPAGVSAPSTTSRRQVKSWFGATPCRRATKLTVMPESLDFKTDNIYLWMLSETGDRQRCAVALMALEKLRAGRSFADRQGVLLVWITLPREARQILSTSLTIPILTTNAGMRCRSSDRSILSTLTCRITNSFRSFMPFRTLGRPLGCGQASLGIPLAGQRLSLGSLPNGLELLSLPSEVEVSVMHRTGRFAWN
jgi:hypothetical protein